MEIALFTYFAADNYGATLQAYATIKALKQLGHDVTLVNYVIPEPPRSALKNLILYPKHLKFERFRKKYFDSLTKSYLTFESLRQDPPVADVYMTGSDQTWNPDISKQLAMGYFLDFGDTSIRRVTYAASIGLTQWHDTEWAKGEDVKKALQRFDKILIREKSGQELLKNEFGIDSTVVLDPVLLFSDYSELAGKVDETNELLTYKLINDADYYQVSADVAHRLGVTPRILGSIRRVKGFRSSYPESIEKWISRIAGCKYMITDSFHGTVLSLIYHRQFASCVGDQRRFTRIESLLQMLDLEERIVKVSDGSEGIAKVLNTPIDYDRIDRQLKTLRSDSLQELAEELM